ncbi:MAG: hypothetical protein Q9165_004541 [Trypethelium subeluteriae]
MATIKPIEGRSIHQIQSGQVIVDLCSVVKELVENSLDAHATSIDVRFKSHGLDSIEVQDNGEGINPENYETVALKHYTSKLLSYEDLSSLQTFGFRGEALSSLCALSNFHIRTAQEKDVPKGTRLDFETSGKLKATSIVASQKGTTVAVEDIFRNLPVRRKELEKNVKREYGKVLNLLHAYACIGTGVRFIVSNQVTKNKKVTVFSTKMNSTTKENIANIYGAKTLPALIPLDLMLELEPSNVPTQGARTGRMQSDTDSREVQVIGHISRPVFGEGRQTPDRQMFFVNSRPCALPQVTKAFNEVYKSFNVSQSPFIFANLKLDTNAYDVNVSPDKRTILLHDQTMLLENIKTSLTRLFESHDQSVPLSQLPAQKVPPFKPLIVNQQVVVEQCPSKTPELGVAKNGEGHADASRSREASSLDSWGTPENPSVNLIENFARRNAISQVGQSRSRSLYADQPKEKQCLPGFAEDDERGTDHDMQGAEGEVVDAEHHREKSIEDNMEKSADDIAKYPTGSINLPRIPNAVQDFNDRMVSQQAKRQKAGAAEPRFTPEDEEPITSLSGGSRRASPGPVQNAFDRMRPKRRPIEEATITIGDITTTTTIGPSSSAKKPRTHYVKDSSRGKSPISLFSKILRAFSAPGTLIDDDQAAEDDSAEEDLGLVHAKNYDGPPEARSEADSSVGDDAKSGAGSSDGAVKRHNRIRDVDSDVSEDGEEKEDEESFSIQEGADSSEGEDGNLPSLHSSGPEGILRASANEDGSGDEYIDDAEKKAREDAKVAQLIQGAEEAATKPTEDNLKRAAQVLKGRNQKTSTLSLIRNLEVTIERIDQQQARLSAALKSLNNVLHRTTERGEGVTVNSAEERLSLTVSKSDFDQMAVIGQFNLGFIIALRPSTSSDTSDELFIIDQHASDEKFNFERLQRTTIVQNQRLVHPLTLELTAIEEETVLEHPDALARNGFLVEVDTEAEDVPVGRRTKLLGLPISREVTFTLSDLEELLVLLREWHGSTTGIQSPQTDFTTASNVLRRTESTSNDGIEIPRPGKVRKMFAMRACRGSIMVGRTLTHTQMQRVVRHLGGLDKPWNCPHGRPTMRHLAGLGEWRGWREGDGLAGLGEEMSAPVDWMEYLKRSKEGRSRKAKVVYGATGSEWTESDGD